MSQTLTLTMPQPGETITQGTVVRWLVSEGQTIKEKEPIAELETEKAVFEYESPFEGKIIKLLVGANSTVNVGEPLALIEVSDEKAKTYSLLGLGQTVLEAPGPATVQKPCPKKIPLSPLLRRLIAEGGISETELEKITSTGPGGRLTKEDILGYLDSRKAQKSPKDEIIPCTPIRLRIAEHMVLSKQTIPHAHTGLTVDLSRLSAYRQQNKDHFKTEKKISLGIAPLVFPALKKAIFEHPLVNASFKEDKKEIVIHKYINLGMAVDTERGLYVVVVRNAQKMGFVDFARELAEAVQRAKQNKLKPEDLTGVTFTLNNYGFYGTRFGVQIILPPQSTTLGMGKIEKRPWVVDDQIHIRELADFTMAFDHRVMDGRDAGLFLNDLKRSLENFSEDDTGKI